MIEMINSRSQFSNFSITNILGEEEGENGIDRNGEMISRIKQEKIDILGKPIIQSSHPLLRFLPLYHFIRRESNKS